MNTITIKITIENLPIEIKVRKNTDYHVLKEFLRDTLSPKLSEKHNWGRIIEIIRDNATPHFN